MFQSTRPVRGATARLVGEHLGDMFQSTRPVRGATAAVRAPHVPLPVSIHAPRAGRDKGGMGVYIYYVGFNPRAPCGARPRSVSAMMPRAEFQSTRPVRGATAGSVRRHSPTEVSIHAPRAGRDLIDFSPVDHGIVSIHAPRAGRDSEIKESIINAYVSIHAPRAGRDVAILYAVSYLYVSIHAPRAGRDLGCPRTFGRRRGFNPRAPCGARLARHWVLSCVKGFNPRAPCGARHGVCSGVPANGGFNPRAPCGARPLTASVVRSHSLFQSTRPVRGATTNSRDCCSMLLFQSTRPVRGATRRAMYGMRSWLFQSTRPVRGATLKGADTASCTRVSIHAPRAGRDPCSTARNTHVPRFNPRAPCGARPVGAGEPLRQMEFQSTRPVRGATARCPVDSFPQRVSIHAPRAGRDHRRAAAVADIRGFNPRAPCGARRPQERFSAPTHRVSIHAPRAGRDTESAAYIKAMDVSIHAPRAGRDAW